MPTPTKGPRLGGSASHEKKILANLSVSLFENKSVKTTVAKAKRLRPYAERLVTLAKKGDIPARRKVVGLLSPNNATNKGVVHELFTVIGPAMANREGGYTRITKIGNRSGDNAPMAVIELVMEPVSPKQAVVKEAEAVAAANTDEEAVSAESESAESADSPESAESVDSAESADSADEAKEEKN